VQNVCLDVIKTNFAVFPEQCVFECVRTSTCMNNNLMNSELYLTYWFTDIQTRSFLKINVIVKVHYHRMKLFFMSVDARACTLNSESPNSSIKHANNSYITELAFYRVFCVVKWSVRPRVRAF